MVVVGKYCVIFDDTGKTCTVNTFSESTGKFNNVPIVNAADACYCPYHCKTFLLLMRNALYIPELDVNLLPPFIVGKSGTNVQRFKLLTLQ